VKEMANKFSLGTGPFLRASDEKIITTKRMMNDVVICLVPIILFAWFKNGILPYIKLDNVSFLAMLWPLLFVLVGGLTSMLLEAVYFYCFKNIRTFKALLNEVYLSYAVIPGLLLALVLPLYTPIWVLMIGCLFANIIFKMLFGGFGYNIFNPALLAYVIVITAFSFAIPTNATSGTTFNPYEDYYLETGVTPLTNYTMKQDDKLVNIGADYDTLVKPYGSLANFAIGTIPGAMGETSAILCILAFIYLVIRKTISWQGPVIYIGTVFVITLIVGLVNGQGLWYPVFNVLSGGLLFGAVFMATEPVTTPRSPNGKIIFALGLGVLTCLFRLVGSFPEGVATSILFMCLFTPLIDRFAAKLRITKDPWKIAVKYAAIAILFIAIAGYTVFKTSPAQNKPASEQDRIAITEVLE
jgi:electron transport complex protein RnfD